MRAFQFDFQSNSERLLHERQGFRFRWIKMFHDELAVIDGIGQGHHARNKHISGAELARRNNPVPAYHIRNQAAHLLKISNVITCQFSVGAGKFGSAHPHITVIEVLRIQEFAGRRSGQLEALRRFNLVQPL